MRTRPCEEGPRVAKVVVHKSRDRDSPRREILVPEWVAYSVHSKEEILESRTQAFAVPSCVRVPTEEQCLSQLQGLSRFRTGTSPCRCVVPPLLLESSHAILRALHELQCFIQRGAYYVEAYDLGSAGVNQHMRAIAEANFLCWDFAYLLQNKIAKEHYLAFVGRDPEAGASLTEGPAAARC